MRLFVFGLGYSARAAVRRMRGRFAWIGGTTRNPEAAADLAKEGVEVLGYDGKGSTPEVGSALSAATHVLVSIAPDEAIEGGDPVLRHFGATLAVGRPKFALAYLSTVGVYGDHGGAWVDERTRCRPVSRRSIMRLAVEERWQRLSAETGTPVSILRLSGIYGPGRNGLVNLVEGTARRLVKPGQVFNRIHVDDIAQGVELALFGRAKGIFNVTDDEPAPPQDVVAYAALLLGLPPPPEQDFETAELTPMARSFYGENKRVSNMKSKRELGMSYDYPNYRVAFDAMIRERTWR